MLCQNTLLPEPDPGLNSPESVIYQLLYHHVATYLVSLQVDYEKRLLQLSREGKADLTRFSEILQHGVDVNIYDEVSVQVYTYSSRFPIHLIT